MVVPTAPLHAREDTIDTVGSSSKKQQKHPNSVVLEMWLQNNERNLYPSRQQKERLGEEAQMSYGQVARWFANRRRKLKMRSGNASPNSSSSSGERHGEAPSPTDSTGELPGFSPPGQTSALIWSETGSCQTSSSGVIQRADREETKLWNNNNTGEATINGDKRAPLPSDAGHLRATPPASEKSLFQDPQTTTDVFGNPIGNVFDGFHSRPSASILTNPFLPIGLNGIPDTRFMNPYFWTLLASANPSSFSLPQNNLSGNGVFPFFATDHLSKLLVQAQLGQQRNSQLQQEVAMVESQLPLREQAVFNEKNGQQILVPNWSLAQPTTMEVEMANGKAEFGQSLIDEITDLEEKESIAVSVLATFAFQRRQLKEEGIEVDA